MTDLVILSIEKWKTDCLILFSWTSSRVLHQYICTKLTGIWIAYQSPHWYYTWILTETDNYWKCIYHVTENSGYLFVWIWSVIIVDRIPRQHRLHFWKLGSWNNNAKHSEAFSWECVDNKIMFTSMIMFRKTVKTLIRGPFDMKHEKLIEKCLDNLEISVNPPVSELPTNLLDVPSEKYSLLSWFSWQQFNNQNNCHYVHYIVCSHSWNLRKLVNVIQCDLWGECQ